MSNVEEGRLVVCGREVDVEGSATSSGIGNVSSRNEREGAKGDTIFLTAMHGPHGPRKGKGTSENKRTSVGKQGNGRTERENVPTPLLSTFPRRESVMRGEAFRRRTCSAMAGSGREVKRRE